MISINYVDRKKITVSIISVIEIGDKVHNVCRRIALEIEMNWHQFVSKKSTRTHISSGFAVILLLLIEELEDKI